jgi:ABC-type nickel/cobalt efflux system permease component RcnA
LLLQLSSCKKDDFGCGFGVRVMWHHFVLRIYMSSSKPKTSSSLRQEEEEDDHDHDHDHEQETSGESLSHFCCPVSAYHENLLQQQLFLLLLELFLFHFSSKSR